MDPFEHQVCTRCGVVSRSIRIGETRVAPWLKSGFVACSAMMPFKQRNLFRDCEPPRVCGVCYLPRLWFMERAVSASILEAG